MRTIRTVCIYAGSSPGRDPAFAEAARNTGVYLASQGIDLVYGGADVGLMGEAANAVLQNGGRVTGVIPESLAEHVAHSRLTEIHVVPSMHERKQRMFDLADAFIALPGGMGTLEEITEVLTWIQLGLHDKPCGLLNIHGYFDALLAFLDHAVAEGFLRKDYRGLLLVSDNAPDLLDAFRTYSFQAQPKWAGLHRNS